jgi:hypothetical protein
MANIASHDALILPHRANPAGTTAANYDQDKRTCEHGMANGVERPEP